jgi:membrane-bound serine protease (ClpP class)
MDFLLDPNIAYLVLLAGIFLTFLAIATPGTGLAEAGALFCFVLAGYSAYHLSVNWWALILLMLSVVPFVQAIRTPKGTAFLAVSLLLLVAGSVFLFGGEGQLISVNPLVAFLSAGLVSISLWFVLRKGIQVMHARPTHDLGALVGQVGDARSSIHRDGSVYIDGELWSARSDAEIPAGSHVRVVGREGLILVVKAEKSES